jgi:uncharacterized phiE125 gp8 family phage protein
MALRRISDPVGPALPIQAVQQHLRVVTDDDLLHITGLLYAATNWVEQYLGRALIQQGWELTLDSWPDRIVLPSTEWQYRGYDTPSLNGWISLPRAPILSVTEVRYVNGSGISTVLSPSTYQLDRASAPGRLAPAYGTVWPSAQQRMSAITVTYLAGYGASWNDVPESIRHAIMMMVAHFYENREAVVVGTIASELPMAVPMLLDPYLVAFHA